MTTIWSIKLLTAKIFARWMYTDMTALRRGCRCSASKESIFKRRSSCALPLTFISHLTPESLRDLDSTPYRGTSLIKRRTLLGPHRSIFLGS